MRQRVSIGVPLVLFALAASCGRGPTPTQPSPTPTPAAPSAKVVAVTGLLVEGPATVPPGESAQYTATAGYSDGSSSDVTSQTEWHSTDDAVLSVMAAGAVVARANGNAQVIAAFGPTSNSRAVVVVPAGRFRLQASVMDDQPGVAVYGARVEVVSGPAAGLATTTDWGGRATLYGVVEDTELRFSKDGYEPLTQHIHVVNNFGFVHVQLYPVGERLDLAGQYRLTISSGPCAGDGVFPDELKIRSYTARLWNAGLRIMAELSGADFAVARCPVCGENRGNFFTGSTQMQDATFSLIEYGVPTDWNDGIYPNVVERLPDGRLLTIGGHAVVTPTAEGYAGMLDGSFAICGTLDLTFEGSTPIASCRSASHRFTLAR
jgi:hypothetical protein